MSIQVRCDLSYDKEGMVIVAGTNRAGSLTGLVARRYVDYLSREGMKGELLSLADVPSDFTFSALYGEKGCNGAFNVMARMLEGTNRVVWIVPEYNGSFPGVLKAFIDGLDVKKMRGKLCGLIGLSSGRQGCLMGLSHLTDIFHHLGMHVYPKKLSFPNMKVTSDEELEGYPQYLGYLRDHVANFAKYSL